MAKHKILHEFGDSEMVYLKHDPKKELRMVTAVCCRSGLISYDLQIGSDSSWHYEKEISRTPEYKQVGFVRSEPKRNKK